MYNNCLYSTIIFALLLVAISPKCAYTQRPEGGTPYIYDGEAFAINYTMTACQQYIGRDVCCNQANAKLTANNLKQLEGVFSTASGGCDICLINLKRLWCEYACSSRQSEFLNVSEEIYEYPDPEKPGHTITAQQANLTIEASTACALYSACKRTPFVSSVSALSSPAGFLNFQGHNAIDDARQYISVYFTYDPKKGLYFNNLTNDTTTLEPTPCNYIGTELHGFPITESCSCNVCEQACDASQGFHYEESSLLQGFNYGLVFGIWGGVIVVSAGLSYLRFKRQKKHLQ